MNHRIIKKKGNWFPVQNVVDPTKRAKEVGSQSLRKMGSWPGKDARRECSKKLPCSVTVWTGKLSNFKRERERGREGREEEERGGGAKCRKVWRKAMSLSRSIQQTSLLRLSNFHLCKYGRH